MNINGELKNLISENFRVLSELASVLQEVDALPPSPPAHVRTVNRPTNTSTNTAEVRRLENMYVVAVTLWGEARGEGEQGMHAVLNVIMNRARNNIDNAFDVVTKPKQFSFWNDKSDPRSYATNVAARIRRNAGSIPDSDKLMDAIHLVDSARSGTLTDITGGATFYFNPKLANPSWAKKLVKTKRIGHHDFYKLPPKKK